MDTLNLPHIVVQTLHVWFDFLFTTIYKNENYFYFYFTYEDVELRNFNYLGQGGSLITGRGRRRGHICPSPNPMLCSRHHITPKGILHTQESSFPLSKGGGDFLSILLSLTYISCFPKVRIFANVSLTQ